MSDPFPGGQERSQIPSAEVGLAEDPGFDLRKGLIVLVIVVTLMVIVTLMCVYLARPG